MGVMYIYKMLSFLEVKGLCYVIVALCELRLATKGGSGFLGVVPSLMPFFRFVSKPKTRLKLLTIDATVFLDYIFVS